MSIASSTSCWDGGLARVLDGISAEFGIAGIKQEHTLDHARQTGFVWTRQPGVTCLAMNRKYFALARENPDVAAIITVPAVSDREDGGDKAVVVAARADELYHHLHASQHAAKGNDAPFIDSSARIHDSACISGDVRIEADVVVGPRSVIQGPAVVRRGTVIEAGVIVGCEGLYAKTVRGTKRHMPHFGGVDIGEEAFIHAGAVIVRSAIMGESTRIGARAHIGIMTNIGHDSTIGEEATISSNVVIAGRVHVGARAWLGASATVSNMVEIGEDAKVRLGAVVIRDVQPGAEVSGNFARSHRRLMRDFMNEVNRES